MGTDRGALRRAAASVYAGAAVGDPGAGSGRAASANRARSGLGTTATAGVKGNRRLVTWAAV